MRVDIRLEEDGDIQAIHEVEFRAFRSQSEPALIERLREEDAASLSLVAEVDSKVVGHILFSPMTFDPEAPGLEERAYGLAPLAVLPEFQKQGIGKRLVERGLSLGISARWSLVFVLGDPAFFSRFGFKQASKYNFYSEYEVPEKNFMVVSLTPAGLSVGQPYLVKYHPVFKELKI